MKMDANQRVNLLLNVLADGEFHSGQHLAEQIGVSRTAVWKLVAKLQSWDIEIYSVKGKGYKIPDGLNLIDKNKLDSLVENRLKHFPQIDLLTTIDSTSTYISNKWDKSAEKRNGQNKNFISSGRVCIAEHQSEGRGRKGNQWISPFGANLYFSIGIELPVGLSVLGGLSLAIGIGLTEAINNLEAQKVKTAQQVKLKWPNDLLCNNRKLAGILVEASGDSNDTSFINIGIGINWDMPEKFSKEINQPWINLLEILSKKIDKTRFMANLLIELDQTIDRFIHQGFEAFNKKWEKNSAFIDQAVTIKTHNANIDGIEKGIDKNGAIIVQTNQGEKTFYSGEVSLRGKQ
ncbi:MAG: biotin--[acetyl-CoA-carboxylase] synthetase [Gammaproteobacteria bacterium]|nr:MAG: biotin--[acetyl-CoA-carboxylase] synthetase [Gammaproteobacteria bacterium]